MQIQFNRMHVITEDYTRSEERMISCLMKEAQTTIAQSKGIYSKWK